MGSHGAQKHHTWAQRPPRGHDPHPLLRRFIDNLADARQAVGEETYALWMDLDRLLIQLSESDAVRVTVRCWSLGGNTETREYVESLLPEVARGGSGRLVDYAYDDV